MAHVLLNKMMMLKALKLFDEQLPFKVNMILGGGGAMVLAHRFPVGTYDIDAVPLNTDFAKLDIYVKNVAKKLKITPDWLNPYFSTFAHTLPQDFGTRTITVYKGEHLQVDALGITDMLVLKIFAGRQKDVPHARLLYKKGADISLIEKHLSALKKNSIPGVDKAFDFLDELTDSA